MTILQAVDRKKDEEPIPEEDEDPTFDQNPVKVVCPHCGLNIITFIEHEPSWVTYAACAGLLLVLGWAALCVIPIFYPLFKDVVHHCPRCLSVLATRSRVVLPSFKQEVMSFRFGSCVVVLARKYVLMLTALTVVIGGIHCIRSSSAPPAGIDAVVRTEFTALTWEDFTKDCGFKSYLGNPIHVNMAFNQKYKNKTLHWTGSVHHGEEGLSFLWLNQKGALYVRMHPPQFPQKREMADLVLLYNEKEPVATEVAKLKRGSNFSFDATMVEVGKRGNPHVMVVWEIQHSESEAAKKRSKDSADAPVTPEKAAAGIVGGEKGATGDDAA